MNTLLKATCLAFYLLAAVGTFIAVPSGVLPILQYVALILLTLHVLELLVAFKSVRLYPGSLVDSIALTLLFGLLHWLPLARERSLTKTADQ